MTDARRADFDESEIEPFVGPVYATRIFRLGFETMALVGLSHPQPSLDGVNVAVCAVNPARSSSANAG